MDMNCTKLLPNFIIEWNDIERVKLCNLYNLAD